MKKKKESLPYPKCKVRLIRNEETGDAESVEVLLDQFAHFDVELLGFKSSSVEGDLGDSLTIRFK